MGNALSRRRSASANISSATKPSTSSGTTNANGDVKTIKPETNGSAIQTDEITNNGQSTQSADTNTAVPKKEKKKRRFFFSLKRSRHGSARKKKTKKIKSASASPDQSPDGNKKGIFTDDFHIPEDDGIDAVSLSSNEDKKKDGESSIRRSKRGSKNGKKSKKKKQKSEKKKEEKSKKKKKNESKPETTVSAEATVSDNGVLDVNQSVEPLQESVAVAESESVLIEDDGDLVAAITAVMDSKKSDENKLEPIVESTIQEESSPAVESAPSSPGAHLNEDGTPKRVSLGPLLKTSILKKYSGAGDLPPESQRVTLTKPKVVEVTDLVPPPRKNKARRTLSQSKLTTEGGALDTSIISNASTLDSSLDSTLKETITLQTIDVDVSIEGDESQSKDNIADEAATVSSLASAEFCVVSSTDGGGCDSKDATLAEKAKAVVDLVIAKTQASMEVEDASKLSQVSVSQSTTDTSDAAESVSITETSRVVESELTAETSQEAESESKAETSREVETEPKTDFSQVTESVPFAESSVTESLPKSGTSNVTESVPESETSQVTESLPKSGISNITESLPKSESSPITEITLETETTSIDTINDAPILHEVEIIVQANKVLNEEKQPDLNSAQAEADIVIERIHSEPYYGPIGADMSPVSQVIPERDENVDDSDDAAQAETKRHSEETGEVCKECAEGEAEGHVETDGDRLENANNEDSCSSTTTGSTIIEGEVGENRAPQVVEIAEQECAADSVSATDNTDHVTVIIVSTNGDVGDSVVKDSEKNNNKNVTSSETSGSTKIFIENKSDSTDLVVIDNQDFNKNEPTSVSGIE